MARKGTYYTGRVLKLGTLDKDGLIRAIKDPVPVRYRSNEWSFLDVEEIKLPGRHYITGKLGKYAPDGEVGVVDRATNSTAVKLEPDLLVASSPFVYIPDHSGIAFLKVPGQIEQRTFHKRFASIVVSYFGGFFVNCEIDPLTDLKTFSSKISSLSSIFKIEAKVSPPNPLFGPLWKSLKDYLEMRNADRLNLMEDAPVSQRLNTDIPELVSSVASQTEAEAFIPSFEVSIGDAAILMAADGYGIGKIRGIRQDEVVVIRTDETTLSFEFDADPPHEELYLKALSVFEGVQAQRHMEHGA